MPEYRIYGYVSVGVTLEIDAESPEEAHAIAKNFALSGDRHSAEVDLTVDNPDSEWTDLIVMDEVEEVV